MGGSSDNISIAHSPAAAAANSTPVSAMSTTVNLVMTTFGFLVSAVFIFFVLVRLLCARFQNRRFSSRRIFRNQGIERGTSGMDPILVTLFPTIKFSSDTFTSQEDAMCAVCLGEYEDRDFLRILPQCGHTFHANCIDAWLRQHATCPVCRIHLKWLPIRRSVPSPLLSEAARLRFSPGVIPESLFEQPLLASGNPLSDFGATDANAHNHAIQINIKEESGVASQNSPISSTQNHGPLEGCEGRPLCSERLKPLGETMRQDTRRPSSLEMVQVQMLAEDPSSNSHLCKSRSVGGLSTSRCPDDDEMAGRSSFSAWMSRS